MMSHPDAPVRTRLFHFGHPDEHIPMFDPPETPSRPIPRLWLLIGFILALGIAALGYWLEHIGEDAIAPQVALPWLLPFACLLGCIAMMPFIARHLWEHYYPHIALALAAIVTLYYLFFLQADHAGQRVSAAPNLAKSFAEYISFIYLLGALFAVSGGILIRVHRRATPLANAGLLLMGALLANLVGTTGAAMLLIRPYLRMNKGRLRPYHIVFFIFIVANVGGALTPIGDPPLFLGYLKGVPFWWVGEHCWPLWATAVGLLLAVFFLLDLRRQPPAAPETAPHDVLQPPVVLYGVSNLLFIALILFAVFQKPPIREMLLAAAAFGSLATTSRRIHVENHFNFAPIREVALLFIGIFATMVPALNYLKHHAHDPRMEQFLRTPGQYFFVTGALSSVLDNAPTYLTFLETELGRIDPGLVERAARAVQANRLELSPKDRAGLAAEQVEQLERAHEAIIKYHPAEFRRAAPPPLEQVQVAFLLGDPRLNLYLVAISMGAVFFGACTYIGNGPNFMVKSIAEHAGVPTPSFFGYILVYTLPVLLPVLLAVWAIFLLR